MTADRVFKAKDRYGNEPEFQIIDATLKEERESEMQYRIAYNEALKHGLMPRDKMKEIMLSKDIWTEKDDKQYKELLLKISRLEIQLKKQEAEGDQKKCAEIALELGKVRSQLMKAHLMQQSSYINSCEGFADHVRVEALVASCVRVKATNERYWQNYSEYVLERENNLTSQVAEKAFEVYTAWLMDANKDTISNYPEQKWIKDYRENIFETIIADVSQELEERKGTKKKKNGKRTVASNSTKTKTSNRTGS